jgi:hypothetical protein
LVHLLCWCDFVVSCYAIIGVELSSVASVFLQVANTYPLDRKVFREIRVRCCLRGTDCGQVLMKPRTHKVKGEVQQVETFWEVSTSHVYVCCCVITVESSTPQQNDGLTSNLTCSVAFMLANRNLWNCISVQFLTLQFLHPLYLCICQLLMAV